MSNANAKVADHLRRYAAALSLEGANRFKLKAYRRAAEVIEDLDDDVSKLVDQGSDLTELPGIGKAISSIIAEIVRTGKLSQLDRTLEKLDPALVELAARPRLDPQKVARVYKKLGIDNLSDLKRSLDNGAIGERLGTRLEYHIRQGLDDRPQRLLHEVQPVAKTIERFLRSASGVTNVAPAGSLRRKQETVGDLNFLVAGKSAASIFKRFASFGGVLSAEPHGDNESLFQLSSGLTVALRWAPLEEWGLALLFATGAAPHLDDLRSAAASRKTHLTSKSLRAKGADLTDEANVYEAIGLPFIEPELREGRGEVAAAADGTLPHLIQLGDLRGDLHMHTMASDGVNSIAEMAAAAQERGYEYIAITDHSQSLKITNGLSEERLVKHIREIDRVNAKLKGFRILKSAEVDILDDGKLDYGNAILKELDLTICSIHSRFGLNREMQTKRIMRAMDNRYFTILGHATGRLLLRRPGYDLDMERIIEHAHTNGCFFEINSSPDRLDLSDEHAKLAKDHGVKIALNTDAHSIAELGFMPAGINQARRGWLTAADVLNTRPLEQLVKLVRR